MKKGRGSDRVSEMRKRYDFRDGVRGKYAARVRQGTNIVVLDPDVAKAFPDSRAVNRALRAFLKASPRRDSRKRRGKANP
jgi:hypothetical protein